MPLEQIQHNLVQNIGVAFIGGCFVGLEGVQGLPIGRGRFFGQCGSLFPQPLAERVAGVPSGEAIELAINGVAQFFVEGQRLEAEGF